MDRQSIVLYLAAIVDPVKQKTRISKSLSIACSNTMIIKTIISWIGLKKHIYRYIKVKFADVHLQLILSFRLSKLHIYSWSVLLHFVSNLN